MPIILTTTIGSYPKPSYVPVANWWRLKDSGVHTPTTTHTEYLEQRAYDNREILDRGTRAAVLDQVEAGIDIPTDGEIRREHYVYYHCRQLRGIDFARLTRKSMRGGTWEAEVPTITNEIVAGSPFLVDDWRYASSVTNRPVKITVPGPMTIMDSMADSYYGEERHLGAALADAINVEIRALAEAGCEWIQVDEPVFARYPEMAAAYGIDLLSRCFYDVPPSVVRMAHVCCGYPSGLDKEHYEKAAPDSYFAIADALEEAPIDVLSLEDAHRHNDLSLLERFSDTRIALGVIDIARTRIETVDEIVARLEEALAHIDAERLLAAPDCGLSMLDRDKAWAKLAVLSRAAKAVSGSHKAYGQPQAHGTRSIWQV